MVGSGGVGWERRGLANLFRMTSELKDGDGVDRLSGEFGSTEGGLVCFSDTIGSVWVFLETIIGLGAVVESVQGTMVMSGSMVVRSPWLVVLVEEVSAEETEEWAALVLLAL